MDPLTLSVRADLFRVAANFSPAIDAKQRPPALCGVRIEPVRRGGALLVGYDGADLIAVCDPEARVSRPVTVRMSKAILHIAQDLFRKLGPSVLIRADDARGFLYLEGDSTGHATHDFEVHAPFPDWRKVLAPHACTSLKPPFVYGARMARKLGDAAIGLARAAGVSDEAFVLKGGAGALIATFPAWFDAVAMFTETEDLADLREDHASTLWHPPHWAHAGGLALVPSVS